MRSARTPVYKTGALVLAGLVFLTACGAAAPTNDGATAANNAGYPVTVENCCTAVTFDAAPHRLVLLKSASVPALHALGVLDRAVARAGAFPDDYFDESTLAELDAIPQLTSDVDATGHLQISKDVVIAQEPDLVFGEVENLPRKSMAQVNIPLLEEPAFRASGADTSPTFDSVYDQLEVYGEVINKPAEADTVIQDLQDRATADETQPAGQE